MIDIFEYFDFRLFLKDWQEEQKESGLGFSFRTLADVHGLGSHSHFFDVVNGRTLSGRYIDKYVEMVGLSSLSEEYFRGLVTYEQSSGVYERTIVLKNLLTLSPQHKTIQLEVEALEFFSSYECPILLQVLAWRPKVKCVETLGKLIYPRIGIKKTKLALNKLIHLKFVEWNKAKEEWVILNKHLSFKDVGKKMILHPYHTESLSKGLEQYKEKYEDQSFSTLSMATSESVKKKIEEKMVAFRKQIVELVKADPKIETVLQINMQMFEPVKDYHPREKKKKEIVEI